MLYPLVFLCFLWRCPLWANLFFGGVCRVWFSCSLSFFALLCFSFCSVCVSAWWLLLGSVRCLWLWSWFSALGFARFCRCVLVVCGFGFCPWLCLAVVLLASLCLLRSLSSSLVSVRLVVLCLALCFRLCSACSSCFGRCRSRSSCCGCSSLWCPLCRVGSRSSHGLIFFTNV